MSVMVQIRHVPDDLHRRLKSRAALAGMSLSDFLLARMMEIADLPTPEEMRARLEALPPLSPPVSMAEAVREARESR